MPLGVAMGDRLEGPWEPEASGSPLPSSWRTRFLRVKQHRTKQSQRQGVDGAADPGRR